MSVKGGTVAHIAVYSHDGQNLQAIAVFVKMGVFHIKTAGWKVWKVWKKQVWKVWKKQVAEEYMLYASIYRTFRSRQSHACI